MQGLQTGSKVFIYKQQNKRCSFSYIKQMHIATPRRWGYLCSSTTASITLYIKCSSVTEASLNASRHLIAAGFISTNLKSNDDEISTLEGYKITLERYFVCGGVVLTIMEWKHISKIEITFKNSLHNKKIVCKIFFFKHNPHLLYWPLAPFWESIPLPRKKKGVEKTKLTLFLPPTPF